VTFRKVLSALQSRRMRDAMRVVVDPVNASLWNKFTRSVSKPEHVSLG
jgi:hypothetical protein